MGRRMNKEGVEYWRSQIERYEASGQTREEFSAVQGIRVHSLDYWRRKLNEAAAVPKSEVNWVPVKIVEEEAAIDLSVGKVRITVRAGFNHELLSEVIRVLVV